MILDDQVDFRRVKKGQLEISEGVFYEGEWIDGKMDGYGVLQI